MSPLISYILAICSCMPIIRSYQPTHSLCIYTSHSKTYVYISAKLLHWVGAALSYHSDSLTNSVWLAYMQLLTALWLSNNTQPKYLSIAECSSSVTLVSLLLNQYYWLLKKIEQCYTKRRIDTFYAWWLWSMQRHCIPCTISAPSHPAAA
jgi:hypothetical protein